MGGWFQDVALFDPSIVIVADALPIEGFVTDIPCERISLVPAVTVVLHAFLVVRAFPFLVVLLSSVSMGG
jgi:hypothetical protein